MYLFDLTTATPSAYDFGDSIIAQLSQSGKKIARPNASNFEQLASTSLELAPSLTIDTGGSQKSSYSHGIEVFCSQDRFCGIMYAYYENEARF